MLMTQSCQHVAKINCIVLYFRVALYCLCFRVEGNNW